MSDDELVGRCKGVTVNILGNIILYNYCLIARVSFDYADIEFYIRIGLVTNFHVISVYSKIVDNITARWQHFPKANIIRKISPFSVIKGSEVMPELNTSHLQ